jgi:ribosomal protein S18
MNPLLLIGLAVGGIYLLTRKDPHASDIASVNANEERYRNTASPNMLRALDDRRKILDSNITMAEKQRLLEAYVADARAKGLLTDAEIKQLRN